MISHRQYVKFRRLTQAGNTIKGQPHLVLPLTLNPMLRPSVSNHQRRSLVDKDERGIYSNLLHGNMNTLDDCQRITYGGTVATLKHVAAMYVCDPPWPEARMEITIICNERRAELRPGFIEAVNYGIDLHSESGLKMEDVLQGLSKRGTRYAIITHGPLRDESSSCLLLYTNRIRCMEPVTMAELPWAVKHAVREGMWVRKAIKLTLIFPDIDGIMPIVPTAVELDALIAC